MSVGDDVRRKISHIELALKNAGTANAINAIVDALKEVADALDTVDSRARRD
jgi:hypothetical protein